MGFFSNMGAINKINVLLKQVEPKLNFIIKECSNPYYADKNRLKVECGTVSVLMSEIMDIVDSAGRSVFLAPYFLAGKKLSLPEISGIVAQIVQRGEMIANNY